MSLSDTFSHSSSIQCLYSCQSVHCAVVSLAVLLQDCWRQSPHSHEEEVMESLQGSNASLMGLSLAWSQL